MNFILKEKLYNITKRYCSAQDTDLEIRGGPVRDFCVTLGLSLVLK